MNQVTKTKEMKDCVGRCFIRVCKNHGIYGAFRSSFNRIKNSKSDRNPFGYFKNVHEMFDKVNEFTEQDYEKHRRSNDKYEKITMMINHMLHFFLEKGGVNPMKLGSIGQEIFDLSCYGIYGEEFLDDMEKMKDQQPPTPSPSGEKEQWMIHQYLHHMRQGNIGQMSFKDFMEKYGKLLSENYDNMISYQNVNQEEQDDYEWDDVDEEEVF